MLDTSCDMACTIFTASDCIHIISSFANTADKNRWIPGPPMPERFTCAQYTLCSPSGYHRSPFLIPGIGTGIVEGRDRWMYPRRPGDRESRKSAPTSFVVAISPFVAEGTCVTRGITRPLPGNVARGLTLALV